MVICYDYSGESIFLDNTDMTDEEWAFLCRIFGFKGKDPSKYVRFTIRSFEACMKPDKEELGPHCGAILG